ncbi:SDR family oxidoreductase [Roseateles sp. DAIF2]|uniref:SDR family NAD(P)-dependent oxidoreductase n=1 Tax=Roseateles sp. DAIF2 TaxID=2714952 RepID=UPI0018A291B7|nr:SDR family oxidoreductase [Roseateles sp. DAIF2]QPF73930.1 SDR family oxidoreductase [Roseateles sp. DAIF2]
MNHAETPTPIPARAAIPGHYEDLRGKLALITGGSRGLGAATALALARQGVRLALVGRDEAALAASLAAVRACGIEAIAQRADCSRPEELQRLREVVEARLGVPDFLLPFAGGGSGRPMPAEAITADDWRSSVEHNLHASFFTLQAFLPGMLARGSGNLLTMASAGARVAAGAPAAYGAAKAGVIMLTRHLAQELGPRGLRVNCLSPSAVLTERTRATLTPERRAGMLAGFPLGRLGEPEDVAAAALFLLSDASAWISGVVLDVAGGRVMV